MGMKFKPAHILRQNSMTSKLYHLIDVILVAYGSLAYFPVLDNYFLHWKYIKNLDICEFSFISLLESEIVAFRYYSQLK